MVFSFKRIVIFVKYSLSLQGALFKKGLKIDKIYTEAVYCGVNLKTAQKLYINIAM